MTRVTPASIAYIATQVSYGILPPPRCHQHFQARFNLTSSSVFSRTDTTTDSERFYGSILELFNDAEEKAEVDDLLLWWNRYGLHILFELVADYVCTDKFFLIFHVLLNRLQRIAR
jgi:hypothetical protein